MGLGHKYAWAGAFNPKKEFRSPENRSHRLDDSECRSCLRGKGTWTLYSVTTTRFLADDSETVDDECRVARRHSAFLFLSTQGKKGVP